MLSPWFEASGPGAAVAAIRHGRPVVVECLGLSDIRRNVPITPDTVFDLASVSKVFTATAVMHLVQLGALELDATVSKAWPAWQDSPHSRPVTVRDLLQHTSGLRDYLALGLETPTAELTEDFLRRSIPAWTSDAAPGEAFAYSNSNYVVLGWLVEAVSGRPLSKYVDEHLVAPLGMSRLGMDLQPGAGAVAQGYWRSGYGFSRAVPAKHLPASATGDGAMCGSLTDVIAWFTAFFGGAVVPQDTLTTMQTPGRLDSGVSIPYGLGLQVEVDPGGQRWYGHGGSWTRSTVLVGHYLSQNTLVVALSNEMMAPVERLSLAILRLAESLDAERATEGEGSGGVCRSRPTPCRVRARSL